MITKFKIFEKIEGYHEDFILGDLVKLTEQPRDKKLKYGDIFEIGYVGGSGTYTIKSTTTGWFNMVLRSQIRELTDIEKDTKKYNL